MYVYVMYRVCHVQYMYNVHSTQLWTEASFYFYFLPVQVRCGELRVRCSRL